jgi:2-keto-3-deoxy-L-rhamnonate aldolase RhmA
MSLKQRLGAGTLTIGSFVKTPHPHVVEVLGLTGLDCLVLDAEHAPFDRGTLDLCLLAARAAGKPTLVRPAHSAPDAILQALDGGADGVLLPHIRSPAEAEAAVRACRYGPGGNGIGRGYAGSTRAAGYTTRGMARHLAASDPVIVLQIEDAQALDVIDAIAAVPGADALFIGRADLTVALGAATPDDPAVLAAVARICAAGRAAGRPIGMFLPRVADVPHWQAQGASLFLLQSDQEFLLKGAAALLQDAGRA